MLETKASTMSLAELCQSSHGAMRVRLENTELLNEEFAFDRPGQVDVTVTGQPVKN